MKPIAVTVFYYTLFSFLTAALSAQVDVNATLMHQNLERHYIVHLPPAYNEADDLPVVVVLHGGSGSAESAKNFTQMNPVSDTHGFLAVYPQGYGPTTGGGFTWADGRGTSADNLGVDDVEFIHQLLDQLLLDYSIDST